MIKVQEEYIELLSEEINSMSLLEAGHGWRSENVIRGKQIRTEIDVLKAKLENKSQ